MPTYLTDLVGYGPELQTQQRFYPLKRPIVKGPREATKQFPKMPNTANRSGPESSLVLHSDCFRILPIETRVQIATYLSTVDFLSLRQSSRAMVVVFGMQSFWKSRFLVNGDRGFLNCLAADPRNYESKNWRLIYCCTAKIDRSHEHLWAARRQWRNNRWLRERYSMIRASDEQIISSQRLLGELCWKEVSTGLRCDRDGKQGKDWRKCRTCRAKHTFFSQVAQLESSVTGLAVSILREGTETYVTGFDLLNADPERPNTIFGYRLPGEFVTINLYGEQLIGFAVINGEAGIHAIRPIFNKSTTTTTTTSWVGLPEGNGICNSTKLVLEREVKAISGKFDVSHLLPSECVAQGKLEPVLQDDWTIYSIERI